MADLEIRGLKNIVRGSLEEIEKGGDRIGPLMNNDGSYVDPEEMKEVVEVHDAARKAVGLDD